MRDMLLFYIGDGSDWVVYLAGQVSVKPNEPSWPWGQSGSYSQAVKWAAGAPGKLLSALANPGGRAM